MMKKKSCGCYSCLDQPELGSSNPTDKMCVTCETCGNKRCPHATHHDNACTDSNEPGQPGSRYTANWREPTATAPGDINAPQTWTDAAGKQFTIKRYYGAAWVSTRPTRPGTNEWGELMPNSAREASMACESRAANHSAIEQCSPYY